MKIRFISPGHIDHQGQRIKLDKEMAFGLTLPYLAALVPQGHDVDIIDEAVEDINFDEPVDLVGITSFTYRVPRAYWIADRYRERGVPVVMGGFHVSVLPEEALEHCDAVVVGETEGLMPRIIEDADRGKLKGVYSRGEYHDLHDLPVPRYDLVKTDNYILPHYPVQVSRGCPLGCEFCCITALYQRSYRMRPVQDVIRDVENAGQCILFVDDNLLLHRKYAFELFDKLKPLNKLWAAQANLSVAADEEMLQRASQSGCGLLYIGLESLNEEALKSHGKTVNLNIPMGKALTRLKRYNIELFLSMIIGFDQDTPQVEKQIVDFCERWRVPWLFLYILCPFPGTALRQRLLQQGVELKDGWQNYDCTHPVYEPGGMSAKELEQAYWGIMQNFYSIRSICKRAMIPPHFALTICNLISREKLKYRMHPFMGVPWKMNKKLLAATKFFLANPYSLKAAKLIRYAEGRLIK